MATSLYDIVAHKHTEVAERKGTVSLEVLKAQAQESSADGFREALLDGNEPSIKLILEVKPASPSAGVLTETLDLPQLLARYNPYASAISVLTDQRFFNGSLDLLRQVTQASPHPVLCKDFILDPYQVYEARLAGAQAVLLIVKILWEEQLETLYTLIQNLGMTPVVEIQNEAELARALPLNPTVLLINNRNLDTFDISLETTETLAPKIPSGIIRISASGIEHRKDITRLLPYTSCFLIGSSLMRTAPEALPQKLQELAGR
jgi:indole-3-glycerol phosphate synthase / phosphoribosylanthranilate isomerase